MDKKVRKTVRTYLIEENKIVAIKHNKERGSLGNYYDIPGGKIEDNETSEEASIREFKEETGMTITKQHYLGSVTNEYPDRIYDIDIYIVDSYYGTPNKMEKNESMWINILDLQKKSKKIPSIEAINYLKENMNLKIECDINHNILSINDSKINKENI